MRQVSLPIYPVTYPTGYRLNQNESQFPIPERIKRELNTLSFQDLHEYPVRPIAELLENYATYAGVGVEQILVGCGSDEMIHVVTQALLTPEDVVLSPAPDFSMYPIFTTIAHGRHIQTDDLSFDGLQSSILRVKPKLVLLSNPNNPTGRRWTVEELTQLAALVPYLIVDEAYIDFSLENSIVSELNRFPNLIVLRTLSKAFGLANIRIGFLIASVEMAQYFKQFVPPFNISGTSAKIANLFLKDQTYLKEAIDWHSSMRIQWEELFSTIGTVHPSETNFIFVTLQNAEDVWNTLSSIGIHTALHQNAIRITLGNEEALAIAQSALSAYATR